MATTAAPQDRVSSPTRSTERRLTTETKHSTKTSELYVFLAVTVGILLAGLLTKAGDGHDDRLAAKQTWLYVSIVAAAYLISRGLAKSGSREPYTAGTETDRR
jgi:hypothetical protein